MIHGQKNIKMCTNISIQNFMLKTMTPVCFDQLWITFGKEPYQSRIKHELI